MLNGSIVFLSVPESLKDELWRRTRRLVDEEEEESKGAFGERSHEDGTREDLSFVSNPSIEKPSVKNPSIENPSIENPSIENLPVKNPSVFKPSILLPAELAPGEGSLNPETLSGEMIISGMLRVISACGKKSPSGASGSLRRGSSEPGFPSGKNTVSSGQGLRNGTVISDSDIGGAGIPSEWVEYYRGLVLTLKPEIYHEFTSAAIVKAEIGDFDMALEINGVLEALFPLSPGVLLNKALVLEHKAAFQEKSGHDAEKENDEALEAYEAALSAGPVLSDTLFNAGFFFLRRRDFERAKDCLSRYISHDEETEIFSEVSAEKKKQAQKILRDISGQGLDDRNYRDAYDCINRGRDEEGLVKIREYIEKHPRIWNGWFILGWALRKLGRYCDALESFKKALELGGASCDIRNEMAICLMETGDLKSARKELEQALREEPENIKIISNMGVLAMKAGKKDEAAAFFRTVLELDPKDPMAGHFLEEL